VLVLQKKRKRREAPFRSPERKEKKRGRPPIVGHPKEKKTVTRSRIPSRLAKKGYQEGKERALKREGGALNLG